jgi:hypothetical protein
MTFLWVEGMGKLTEIAGIAKSDNPARFGAFWPPYNYLALKALPFDSRIDLRGIKGVKTSSNERGSQKVNLYDNVSSLLVSLQWPSNSCIKCNLRKNWENRSTHLAGGRAGESVFLNRWLTLFI